MIAAAEKAFGGWDARRRARSRRRAAGARAGAHVYFVQRPNSIQSSICGRQHRRQAQRSALVRADARQHDLRRRVQLAHRPQHPRGEGLHLLAAVGAHRRSQRRLLPFAADVRNEVTGPTLTEVFKEIDKLRADGSDGAELQGAKSYLRGIFPIQTATQSGLSAMLNNVYVFGLPKDYPETFRAKIAAVTPEQVKSAAATLLGSENSVIVIVGDCAKVKDQLAALQGHHVPRHRRQDDRGAR